MREYTDQQESYNQDNNEGDSHNHPEFRNAERPCGTVYRTINNHLASDPFGEGRVVPRFVKCNKLSDHVAKKGRSRD